MLVSAEIMERLARSGNNSKGQVHVRCKTPAHSRAKSISEEL